ncbi:MAG: hypothetical protein A2X36_03825 [Elusimicrobia bacterium GWA2_69_24]|nr:MAG: hypothetical protein A2X36_03825 [Elusimicrobia bacterium GWA2_69_24]HBL18934.1 hypothetical protein [Elusimicrobiota bacterium]
MPILGLLVLGFLGMTAAYTAYDKKTAQEEPSEASARTRDPFSVDPAERLAQEERGAEKRTAPAGTDGSGRPATGRDADPVATPPATRTSGSPSEDLEGAAYLASEKFDNRGGYEYLTGGLGANGGTDAPEVGAGSELGPRKNGARTETGGRKTGSGAGTRTASRQGNPGSKNQVPGRGLTSGLTRDDQGSLTGDRSSSARPRPAGNAAQGSCPEGMANIEGRYCIDRWEASVVDRATHEPASPYYTPNPSKRWPGAVWQYEHWSAKPSLANYPMPELPDFERSPSFSPMAVSKPGVYPQGFMNKPAAELACRNAGKRLCAREEWHQACAGPDAPQAQGGSFPVTFPYGKSYQKGMCNFGTSHPLMILKRSNNELSDPRLMLAESGGRRVLARTGDFAQCRNSYGVYDMVGNQDEIVADPPGDNMVFVGSFYSRAVSGTPRGCASAITSHAESYNDYSIGFRCCSEVSN